MRYLLLCGASLIAASPALAQEADTIDPISEAESPIDTLVDKDQPVAVADQPAPTGDPVLDRLNALEARVKQLEARNAQLEEQAELNQGRLETVETRAAKAAQFGWVPSVSDPSGNFTFKPRGVLEADVALFKDLCPQLIVGQTVGAGHFAPQVVPEQVNAMIDRFLAISDLTA